MKYYLLPILIYAVFSSPVLAGSLPDAPHIVVIGEYELRTIPDILTLSLSIAETDLEVAAAREHIEEKSRKLLQSLEKIGIAKDDINSSQLSITPHYNWSNRAQVYVGTEVSRTVETSLRDLSRYDELIRSIIDAGVAKIHSNRLRSSQEKTLRKNALRGAIADGMEKAEIMVAHLPERVGPIYSIAPQSSGNQPVTARYEMASAPSKSAFEPGSITLKESLQIVFYLIKQK